MPKYQCSPFARSEAGKIRRAFQSAIGKAEDDARNMYSKKVRSRMASICMTIAPDREWPERLAEQAEQVGAS
eukprot:scaffold106337_cov74-Phaeocystis_antarctica.AAC.2